MLELESKTGVAREGHGVNLRALESIWGFPKIGDPNIAPEIVGSLL